jgi:hypothetical protein
METREAKLDYLSGENFTERLRRRRIEIAIPVVIQGFGRNRSFKEKTESASVNAYGCILGLRAPIVVAQRIIILNPGTAKKALGMVTFVGLTDAEKTAISIEFFEPSVSFWGIPIPGWNHSDDWRPSEKRQRPM